MLDILNWSQLTPAVQRAALARAPDTDANLHDRVASIVADVRANGDKALRTLTARFDGYDAPIAFIPEQKLAEAANNLAPTLRTAIEIAIKNLTAFHSAQQPKPLKIETQPGITCELHYRPIETVGLYVPGGSAPLFSTVLMSALPAKLAGCANRILCTPPGKDGAINPGILAAAYLCGITKVLPIGGAQAIAALAFGTETVPKTDKIFGPGNAYVTLAKQLVAQESGGAAIDMPAGPSEVMVIASPDSNPAWIAADLLAQAEHGPDSQAILLTTDAKLAASVREVAIAQTAKLPRAEIIKAALQHSRIIVTPNLKSAFAIANRYAPEHLILHGDDAANWVPEIQHAGSIFVGQYTPETAGDYASGTNHVLPTYGYARAYGSLSLLSFMKSMTVQSLTKTALENLAPTLVTLAEAEGLDAHAAAVKVRMQ